MRAEQLADLLRAPLELVYAVNPDDLHAWPRSAHLDSFVHEALPRIQEWIAEDIARSWRRRCRRSRTRMSRAAC
jgi:hypothetical protein